VWVTLVLKILHRKIFAIIYILMDSMMRMRLGYYLYLLVDDEIMMLVGKLVS
jgi:hypothetical protein